MCEAMERQTYLSAGVDLDAARRVTEAIKAHAATTKGPQVLGGVGFFAGLYQLSGYKEPVLVSSTDGVGTKLKVAVILDRYDTIGHDLVNQSVNDILTCGARPLFFLDYIGMGSLVPAKVKTLVASIAQACREVGCALIGGETSEMPGMYQGEDFDMAGFIVGVVEKSDILDGSRIQAGDALLGLPSSGLHTNGYSLARQVFGLDQDPKPLNAFHDELGCTLGEALLAPHRSYYRLLETALPLIKGMPHITGGGLIENVPRVLPEGLAARLHSGSWQAPPIFGLIQKAGNVARDEMYRVFNMGLGMVLVCESRHVRDVQTLVPEAILVGEVVKQLGGERVLLV